jgi:hypothetical protein
MTDGVFWLKVQHIKLIYAAGKTVRQGENHGKGRVQKN